MNSLLENTYSTQKTILKYKFRKYILKYIHSNQTYNYQNTKFFIEWKTKINTEYINNNTSILSILLQLLVSPTVHSKISTIEYYINQLNYNNYIVENFVNDFLVYYSIYIY
jgi:hypothetical protein